MAEFILKKLEQQLQCAICLDIFKEPKLLQCSHIYCKDCLTGLVLEDIQGSLTLSCPVCRQKTPILRGGVATLKPAFHINHLLEIREDLQNQGTHETKTTPKLAEKPSFIFCSSHAKKEVELFCDTCEELICLKCAIKGGKHFTHNYNPIHEALDKCKADISKWLEPVEKQAQVIKQALDNLEQCSRDVVLQKDSLEYSINNAASEIHAMIESEKVELLDSLQKITDEKLAILSVQKSGLSNSFSQLMSCVDCVKLGLTIDVPSQILQLKASVSTLTKELMSSFENNVTHPRTEADIVLLSREKSSILLGSVHTMESCDGKRSYASGAGLVGGLMGEKAKVVIHALNYNGKKCAEPLKKLCCELVSNSGIKVEGNVKEYCVTSCGDYEVEYCPVVSGRHQLYIAINDQPIAGSPFAVQVKHMIQTLKTPRMIINDIDQPWGIAVSEKDDKVVVSSISLKCIFIFSRSPLALLCRFEGLQSGFRSPRGIAIDKDSYLYVCDCENHCILKLTLDGKFISSVGSLGREVLQFLYPKDIAYNTVSDKLYVVDASDRIQVISPDFSPSGIFGMHGSSPGEFDNPSGIACDQSGHIYVADTYNHRIQVFNTDKQFIFMFGSRGTKDGELFDPISVAVDAHRDIVYVSERRRVSIFTTKGTFVATSKAVGMGLTVDTDGVVYICGKNRNRIIVY